MSASCVLKDIWPNTSQATAEKVEVLECFSDSKAQRETDQVAVWWAHPAAADPEIVKTAHIHAFEHAVDARQADGSWASDECCLVLSRLGCCLSTVFLLGNAARSCNRCDLTLSPRSLASQQ